METIKSTTGFYVDRYADTMWCVSGFPTKEYRFREYECAYDVQDMLKEKVPMPSCAECDSEFSQLFILFKQKRSAVAYLKKIEEYLFKVKELV
jgi:hypothetical protein